ncbi:hypothetical protein ONZ45_g10922 [Pleurotus djamor]|nr:hypothetical protein ONZ45_g10922 [Pleurotus djamor]
MLEVAQRLPLGVLLDMSLMSRSTYSLLLPLLYHELQLGSNDQCRATLSYLAREPDVAMFVKKLIIRPNHRAWESTVHQEEQNESWIADLVTIIAAQGKFQQLKAFHWDGMEVPKDKLWVTLRSHFRHHRTFHQVTPEPSSLPSGLWTMLLDRCPNLEVLTLNGRQDHLWRISPITEGRWPRLWNLSLGHHPGGISNHPPFQEFLTAHPLLRDISFTGLRFEPWITADGIPSESTFPAVQFYTGFWPIHRGTIAYPMYKSIRSLTAYHAMWIPSSWMMTSVFPTLKRRLPSLESLSMSVEFRSRVGVTTLDFFRALFASCPTLSHLELLSSSHFDLGDFAAALKDAPSLKTFALVKVPNESDEDMVQSALRFVQNNPALSSFTITHVRPWRRSEEYFIKQKGVFEILPGKSDCPSAIFATETTLRYNHHRVRRYRLDDVPSRALPSM